MLVKKNFLSHLFVCSSLFSFIVLTPTLAWTSGCKKAGRQAQSSASRLTKIAGKTNNTLSSYEAKATKNFITKRDQSRKDELTQQRVGLQSTLDLYIVSYRCGSEQALEDGTGIGWKWTSQICMDGWQVCLDTLAARKKVDRAINRINESAASRQSKEQTALNRLCASGMKLKDRLDSLLEQCTNVERPAFDSPRDLPWGACWTGSVGGTGGGGSQCNGKLNQRIDNLVKRMNKLAGQRGLGKLSNDYLSAERVGFITRQKDRDALNSLQTTLDLYIVSFGCGSESALASGTGIGWKWTSQICMDGWQVCVDAYKAKQSILDTAARVETRKRSAYCRKKGKYDEFKQLLVTLTENCGISLPQLDPPPAAPSC